MTNGFFIIVKTKIMNAVRDFETITIKGNITLSQVRKNSTVKNFNKKSSSLL